MPLTIFLLLNILKFSQSSNPDQSFIHSLILPQSTGWIKKENDSINNKNVHHNSNNSNNNNSSHNNNINNNSNNANNSNNNSNNNAFNNNSNNYNNDMRSQNQNQSLIANGNGNTNANANINNIQQRDHNPLKERNNPREDPRALPPTESSYQNYNQSTIRNNSNNGTGPVARATPHNSTSHPQPNSYHQHHQHHQHQAPPLETELSRFPPQDATYKATNRQPAVAQSNSLPHQAISLQHPSQAQHQQQQQQQQQQLNDFDLEMFSPSSPNPAPHKSSKPNSNFTLTASGVSNQNHQNLQTNINNSMNITDNSNNSTSLIYNQFINNSISTDITCDTDDIESDHCPATRIPEWCQDIKVSTPLSDNTSGVSNSNYSENDSPSDQEKE